MFFEIDATVFYILLLVAVQLGLAGIIVLFWLCRRPGLGARSDKLQAACSYERLRMFRYLVAGTASLAVVGLVAYLFFRPTSPQVSTYYQTPEITPFASTPLDDDHYPADEQATDSAFDEPWRSEKGGGDSHIRETVRKAVQGDLTSPALVRNPLRNPSLNTYMGLINTWLDDAPKTTQSQTQLVDALYDRMAKDYGFQGPKSLLAEYLDSRQSSEKGADPKNFAFLQPDCGKKAQVRWWRKTMLIAGVETPVFFFSMESEWSHRSFIRAFAQGALQTFLDAHLAAFNYFGGIFHQINYIELPQTLLPALQEPGSETNEKFLAFAARYNFKPDLAPVQRQPEKHLDAKLSDLHSLTNIERLNEKLAELFQTEESGYGEGSEQLFQTERLCLLNLPRESPDAVLVPSKAGDPPSIPGGN